jgi:glycosyltransferase involved in cell wall biosynthesis
MPRCRVMVISDFEKMGGAEVVYRQSAELLATLPDVEVECFDDRHFNNERSTMLTRSWNVAAARALEQAILRFRPHRLLVHNYHNALSPSILSVIARHKRELGYRAYHTCHDYHLAYYNPSLQYFENGRPIILPLEALRTRAGFMRRPTPKGFLHDLMTRVRWHAVRTVYHPARVFDQLLCPSLFMQEALHRSGLYNTVLLFNPSSVSVAMPPLVVEGKESFNLAFAGRISPEKGLTQFIELAERMNFERIESIGVYGDGPDRAAIEQRFAHLVERGKLIFFGTLPQEQLFLAMRRFADAVIVPSVGAENAPLIIIEAAMLGIPALVNAGGSMATTAEAVGNKIKFLPDSQSLSSALDQLATHLAHPERKYEVGEYMPEHYARRLAEIMHIHEDETLSVNHNAVTQFADKVGHAR